jgi:hypothetical protein
VRGWVGQDESAGQEEDEGDDGTGVDKDDGKDEEFNEADWTEQQAKSPFL